jgi:hypothetical protein
MDTSRSTRVLYSADNWRLGDELFMPASLP